ncbi:hypothetical protein E3C22_03470 [Jiella endophytica]|uniref:Uncharacterized protein n=1 Tax=Jiella endophytica TaxID=2558362 RepID=A0A4Y8RT96_9HYPH|nr:hypothetical protein [Jiella endophytica]TFF27530.1 hypothetical protein E3C22_03470 [Jiella endophytica]
MHTDTITTEGQQASIRKSIRHLIGEEIERLIGLLDLLDGDADLEDVGDDEPDLGGSSYPTDAGWQYDLEMEDEL